MPDRISRELMYWRVAAELPPGGVVGLGPSLPQSIPGYVPSDLGVVFLSASGLIGPAREARSRGRTPEPSGAAAAGLGLGGMAATPIEVFGAARSGRLEVAVIEASQVSEAGAIADRLAEDGWPAPANEMALGARKTIALMEHTTLMGEPRVTIPVHLAFIGAGRRGLDRYRRRRDRRNLRRTQAGGDGAGLDRR